MSSKLITIITFGLYLSLVSSYRVVDIQNDISDFLEPKYFHDDDLYFMADENDGLIEQKLTKSEEEVKTLSERLKKLEENEVKLKEQLKNSQQMLKEVMKFEDEEDGDDIYGYKKPLEEFWEVICRISKGLLNGVLKFFGILI